MTILRSELINIRFSEDIVLVRQTVRSWSVALKMSLVDQTKIITAASELVRNIYNYAGEGTVLLEEISNGTRFGLRLTFEDKGPGIESIDHALQDGYSTSGGLGLGLGGAKRLSNEFEITSYPGKGTKVIITRWK